MPIAICSPTTHGPLPQYASSPANRRRQQVAKPFSYSSFVAGMDDTSTVDFNAIVQADEVDDTTFSDLAPSITEPTTNSSTSPGAASVSCDNAVAEVDDDLPCGNKRDHSKNYQNQLVQGEFGQRNGSVRRGVPLLSPESFIGTNDGLEWDDSGDLKGGIRTESGSLSSCFGQFSLPLASECGSRRTGDTTFGGCGTGSLSASQSVAEQCPLDQPRRSSFTLAAEAAEVLVSGLHRHGRQRMSSSSTGICSRMCQTTDANGASYDRPFPSEILAKTTDDLSITENGDNKSRRASHKAKLPFVCCSTPTQRASDLAVTNRVESNDCGPPSSESLTIPVPHPTAPTASVTDMTEIQQRQTTERSETMLSLFSNCPLSSLAPRLLTSSCMENPSNLTNGTEPSIEALVDHTWEECWENPVIILSLIRSREAVPLLGLLDRLEQGSPLRTDHSNLSTLSRTTSGSVAHDLEGERVQLDIDRSFLEFYTKELNNWKQTADSLRSRTLCDTCGSSEHADLHVDKTLLAIDSFCDWLSVLRNRVAVCLNHLNRRALWIDQLNGFSHELRSSFAVVEERVYNSLRQAREMLLLWRQRRNEAALQRLDKESSVVDTSSTLNCGQFLDTLDDLQNLSDGVLAFQVRLGSCNLVNDCWSSNDLFRPIPCVLRGPNMTDDNQAVMHSEIIGSQTPYNESSSFCSFFDLTTENDMESTECTSPVSLHVITERAEQLQRRLRSAIKQLERAVVSRADSIPSQPIRHTDQVATVDGDLSIDPVTSMQSTEALKPVSRASSQQQAALAMKPESWNRCVCILALIFLCFAFLFCQCVYRSNRLTSWLGRIHPFCPNRPGTAIVDLSPNWWVQKFTCFQLPNTKDVTW